METPCQSLACSANQDSAQRSPAFSAPPRSRQRPPFARGLFLSILQNLEEEKTSEWLEEKERRERQRFDTRPTPALFLPPPPPPPTPPLPRPPPPPPAPSSSPTGIHFGAMRCLGQEVSRGQRGLGQIEILREFAKFSCNETENLAGNALMGREGK